MVKRRIYKIGKGAGTKPTVIQMLIIKKIYNERKSSVIGCRKN